MISAQGALDLLRDGNHRFASNVQSRATLASRKLREELTQGQEPFAVILGCSDSRVPVEIVFDQGLGDLFVVRVAGNIAGPSQVASVEFGVKQLGARLVVVLGHEQCGAVAATLDEPQRPRESASTALRSVLDRIRPALESLSTEDLASDREALARAAVRANVQTSVNHLRRESEILRPLVQADELLVVGAEYSLVSGVVDFFDDGQELR